MALRIPDPDALWSGDEQIAAAVESHAVRHAVIRSARFFPEDAAVAQCAVAVKVVHPDVALVAVIHKKAFSVRLESQAVGLRELFGQQLHISLAVQAVHALKRDL